MRKGAALVFNVDSQSPPVPADAVSVDAVLADDTVLAETVPVDAVPAEPVPADTEPVDAASAECADGPADCPVAGAARRGRPRSEQAEQAIIDAVFTRFAEGASYDGLSMEAVAAAAGVGKATIYRRWPNKEALVIEAMRRRLHPRRAVPAPGDDIRSDLVFLLEQMREHLQDEAAAPVLSVLIQASATNPGLMHRYHVDAIEPRREEFRVALRRGIARRELRADLDIERALRSLTASMLLATIFEPPPVPVGREFTVDCVDDFLLGAEPR
jgi:AcrR family transcriptional regulator